MFFFNGPIVGSHRSELPNRVSALPAVAPPALLDLPAVPFRRQYALVEPSTASTPSTTAVETVEGIEPSPGQPKDEWDLEAGLDRCSGSTPAARRGPLAGPVGRTFGHCTDGPPANLQRRRRLPGQGRGGKTLAFPDPKRTIGRGSWMTS